MNHSYALNYDRTVCLEISVTFKGREAKEIGRTYFDVAIRDYVKSTREHVGTIKAETLVRLIRKLESGTLCLD